MVLMPAMSPSIQVSRTGSPGERATTGVARSTTTLAPMILRARPHTDVLAPCQPRAIPTHPLTTPETSGPPSRCLLAPLARLWPHTQADASGCRTITHVHGALGECSELDWRRRRAARQASTIRPSPTPTAPPR